MERSQNIDKSKELHFEVLVAHRERHHSLIKSSLAEKWLRMFVDQLKNALAASLDFSLEFAHEQKLIAAQSEVKRREFEHNKKIRQGYGHFPAEFRLLGLHSRLAVGGTDSGSS